MRVVSVAIGRWVRWKGQGQEAQSGGDGGREFRKVWAIVFDKSIIQDYSVWPEGRLITIQQVQCS